MAYLVAIAYPHPSRAAEVLPTLRRLGQGNVLALDDACVVVKDRDGKVSLRQTLNTTAVGAVGGAFWGSLIGLIFLAPIGGAALGAAAGALTGHFTDYGISDSFMKSLAAEMPNDSSAIFMLVRHATVDKAAPEIAKLGGRLLYTSVSTELEKEFERYLTSAGVSEPSDRTTTAAREALEADRVPLAPMRSDR